MATTKTIIEALIKTTGLKDAVADSAKFSANMASGAKSANSVKSTKIPSTTQENIDRGVGRAALPGGTGASARDFAKEAQGLGGLVRLYATYAANIFAVGAAYRALSNAADTTNMVRGLNQLGAASGTALGSLSKRLVEATDGAISLREAMEATAKASSSGISSENILRIGKVAKTAAQALGVDMSDAVSRLTRGITKLEPELLDELGIFTRVDSAVKDYAKSVNKSATALTDFERRMAFANAVLAEGEKKFSAIELNTNPYTKLAASIKDVAQSGLELVNKVLIPIVSYLAQSPTALATVMAGIGVTLLRQALPAIGQFKDSLKEAAEESAQLAKKKADDALNARKTQNARILAEIDNDAEVKLARVEASEKRITEAQKAGIDKRSALYKILQKQLPEINQKDFDKIESSAKALDTKGLKEQAEFQRAYATELKAAITAEERYIETRKAKTLELEKETKGWSTFGQTQRNALEAARTATLKNITANAAYIGSTEGVTAAVKQMNLQLAGAGITGFSKYATLAKGGVYALAGAVSTLGTALSGAFFWLGIITTALTLLDSAFSKNTKQLDSFKDSVDRTDSSLDNLNKTLEVIKEKPLDKQFDAKSLSAYSSAITEVSDSVKKLTTDILSVQKNAGVWDYLIDSFKSIWGGDTQAKFAASMAKTISGALEASLDANSTKKAREELANILDINPNFKLKELEKAFTTISDNEPKLKAAAKAMEAFGIASGITASKSSRVDESLKKAADSYKALVQGFTNKDPLAVFATDLIASAQDISVALEDPKQQLQKLLEIANNTDNFVLFKKEDQDLLYKYSKELSQVNNDYRTQQDAVKSATQSLAKYNEALEESRKINAGGNFGKEGKEALATAEAAARRKEQDLETKKSALGKTEQRITELTAKFPNLAANQLEKGAELLSASIAASMAKGSFALRDAVLGSLGNIPGVAQAREKLELAKLASDAYLLKVMAQQIQATKENSVALELSDARRQNEADISSFISERGSPDSIKRKDASTARVVDLEYKLKLVQANPEEILKSISQVVQQAKAGNLEIARDSKNLMELFTSLIGVGSQLATNAQAQLAAMYSASIGKLQEELELVKRNNQVKAQGVEAQLASISRYETINGLLDESGIKERERLSLLKNELDANTKLFEIETRRRVLDAAQKSKATSLSPEQFAAEQGRLNGERSGVVTGLNSGVSAITLKTQEDLRKLDDERIKRQRELNDLTIKYNLILAESKNTITRINLEKDKSINKYSDSALKAIEDEIAAESIKFEAKKAASDEFTSFERAQQDLYRERSKTTDIEKLDSIDKQLARQTEVHDAILAQIDEKKQAELASIDEIASYREGRENFNSTIESIKAIDNLWAGVGTKLADIAIASDNLAIIQRQNAEDLQRLQEKKDKTEDPAEQLKIEKDIQKSKKKSADTELMGNIQLLSSTKKLFKEKTGAYKVISGMEKAMYAFTMAMEAKKTATMLIEGAKQIAVLVQTIAQGGIAAVVNQGGGDVYTAFARMAAMAVFISSLTGKKVATPSGQTAAEQQAVQGTGQDYVNGKLVDNGGGVLGDKTAKSKDIQDSLSIIADNTTETILFDSKAVYFLRAIENNTRDLAAQFFRVKGLVDGSAFGTVESTRGGGWFDSKRSTSIIDSGIRAIGNLGDILRNPGNFFQQYETVARTRSSWWGGSRTSYSTNVRPVEEEITDILAQMFENIRGTIVSLGETFNLDVSGSLNAILESTNINFQISARGLSGTDLLEAIASEIGVTMNQVVARVYPFLEQFQQVGEGMLTTLTRVTSQVEVVNGQFAAMGVDFLNSFTQGFALVDSTEIIKRRDEAYARYLRADAASREVTDFYDQIVESGGGDAGPTYSTVQVGVAQTASELEELNAAIAAYNELNSQTNAQMYANITATLETYESLVDLEGGLERFTERSQFFLDNFVPETIKLANTTRIVTDRMSELGYASVDTREEFYDLVRGLDLSTEAGRQLYSNLMDVAPAFDMVATASENAAKEAARQLETAISNAGISSSTMADIITKGMLGQMERSEAGVALANMVVGGVYTAIAQNAIEPVIDLIVSGIIQPVIAAAIAGETISGAVSQQSIDAVLASAQAAMQAIGQIFNDPGFQALMGELTSTFNNLIPQSSFTPYVPQTYSAPTSNANSYKDAVDGALKTLEKAINSEKEILSAQLKTQQELVKSIEELISVLDSNIKELLNSVDAVVTMNARQGAQFITNALTQAIQNGTLPNTKDLSEAISAVRTEIDQGNYASKFEADRARLILAGQLDQLKVTSTAQKSNAELQLDSLNNQLEYLDNLLDQSKAQVDALYGVSNAVSSVSSAIASLQSAIANYRPGGTSQPSTYGASFGGGSGSVPTMSTGSGGKKALLPNGGVKSYFEDDGAVRNNNVDWMTFALTGNGFDAEKYLDLNPDVAAWYNANGSAAIAAADQGSSIEQFALYHFSKHGLSEGRAYADGGIFSNSVVTQPTNFNADLMGEAGPEAIVPLSKMPDGSLGVRSNSMSEDFKALVASNNELRKELAIIRQNMQKSTSNSTQQLKLLEDVVRGGELISVEVTNTVKTTTV